jgi:uncharacterized membrane protein
VAKREYTHRQVTEGITVLVGLYVFATFLADYVGSAGAVLLGAICSLLIPGFLALRLLGVRTQNIGEEALYSLGASIAALYAVGLGLTVVLPLFGINEPLRPAIVQGAVVGLNFLLLILANKRRANIGINLPVSRQYSRMSGFKALLYLLPIVTLACGVAGTFMLNDGGANTLSLVALVLSALNVMGLLAFRRGVPPSLYPYTLFWIGLMILLMTSLRGWILSGHDVLMEYHVFQITKDHLNWSMSYLQDAYNACLSVTMLPTMLSGLLLHVPDQYILRLVFQVVFACMPVAVYMLARRYLTPRLAFLAAIFFIAQVPFLRDLMFMTRQEIAFFFYALLALIMTNRMLVRKQRLALFGTFGVALVLSHYSTVYVAVAVLVLARAFCSHPARKFYRKCGRIVAPLLRRFPRLEAPIAYERQTTHPLYLPSWPMVAGLILVILVWNVGVTGTANNLQKFLGSTVSVLDTQHHNSTASEFNVLGKKNLDDKTLTEHFVAGAKETSDESPAAHFAPNTYSNYDAYLPLDDDLQPHVNTTVSNVASVIDTVTKNLVKVLIVIGACWLIFAASTMRASTSLKAMVAANILMLVAVMALPFMSIDYDVMRAYQQFLVFLCIPAVIGAMVVTRFVTKRFWYGLTAGVFVVYSLFMTPFLPQALGYGEAAMSLNNHGRYYDIYYVHQSEIDAIEWLSYHGSPDVPVYADWFAGRKIATFASRPVWIVSNVLPQNITKDGYVFVDVTNMQKGAAYVFYNGNELPYRFPKEFLKANKHLIYTNGRTEIWQ